MVGNNRYYYIVTSFNYKGLSMAWTSGKVTRFIYNLDAEFLFMKLNTLVEACKDAKVQQDESYFS
jgi:hypothetical protein